MSEENKFKKMGESIDAVVTARNRLLLAHVVLAVVSSFAMWKGTESPLLLRAAVTRGGALGMIILSIWAWAPYLVSWVWSRYILADNPRAVLPFIASATIGGCIAVFLMRNTWGFPTRVPEMRRVKGVAVTSTRLRILGAAPVSRSPAKPRYREF